MKANKTYNEISNFFEKTFLRSSNRLNGGWQRGGHDPVSRTNFNKIHASRTVLTKFHESRNSTNEHQSKLLPYPLLLKQRSQETIFICPERGCGSRRFIIANTAIIKC